MTLNPITQIIKSGFHPNSEWASLPLFDRSNWTRVRFGDFAQNVNERVEPTDAADERYVGLEHLDPQNLHIRRWGKGSDVIGTKLRFRKGDIIFGRRRAYQRKLAVAEFDGICSAHAMVVRAKPDLVLTEFLPFLMMSDRFMNRAVEISVGSLSPTINWRTLKDEEFDLPPLEVQRRIAEVLWEADNVIQGYYLVREQVVKLSGSSLRESFGSKAHGVSIPVRQAGEVQLGRQRAPRYQTGTMAKPYLRVANVFDGYFDYSDVLEMDFDENDFATYRLEAGDILLNEGQSRELVGRCAIYDGQIKDCCFQNTLIRFRAGDNVTTEYAFAFFKYCYQFGIFSAIANQTTAIAHLGADRFGALLMPIPSIEEQRRIGEEYLRMRRIEDQLDQYLNSLRNLQNKLISCVTE